MVFQSICEVIALGRDIKDPSSLWHVPYGVVLSALIEEIVYYHELVPWRFYYFDGIAGVEHKIESENSLELFCTFYANDLYEIPVHMNVHSIPDGIEYCFRNWQSPRISQN